MGTFDKKRGIGITNLEIGILYDDDDDDDDLFRNHIKT